MTGGPKESGAKVSGWKAEIFIPFKLLEALGNVPPKPGTTWRANFYRVDHDDGRTTELGLDLRRSQFARVPQVRHAGL